MLSLLLLGLFATSVLGGVPPQARIIDGKPADAGEYPSQLSLMIFLSHKCGASIINANWALTAALCVDGFEPWSIELTSGSLDWSQGTRHTVSRVILHEDFGYASGIGYINDIALIEVVEPFEMSDMVQPVKLPEQNQTTETGSPATMIGWGGTFYGGTVTMELLEVDVEVIDQELCDSQYNGILPTEICGGLPEGGKGSCHGDQGGPMFVDGTIVGIMNYLHKCATRGFPNICTRVSPYRDWIREITGV